MYLEYSDTGEHVYSIIIGNNVTVTESAYGAAGVVPSGDYVAVGGLPAVAIVFFAKSNRC